MDKEDRLKASNTFNPDYDKISDPKFSIDSIMDPRDLLQVRYELVRSVEYDNTPITHAAEEYGVSERTARRYIQSMKAGGLSALIPGKSGPSGPSVLKQEVCDFIDAYVASHPRASGKKVCDAIAQSMNISVGQRTVERYLQKKSTCATGN